MCHTFPIHGAVHLLAAMQIRHALRAAHCPSIRVLLRLDELSQPAQPPMRGEGRAALPVALKKRHSGLLGPVRYRGHSRAG